MFTSVTSDSNLLGDIPEPLGAAMISPGALWDVNLLLNINVFDDPAFSEFSIPPKPSPWLIAYVLHDIAKYFEALVFFDRIVYLYDKGPLHDHLKLFTEQNPLHKLFGKESAPLTLNPGLDEPRFSELISLVQKKMFSLQGFQGLFRTAKGYENFADPLAAPDLAVPMIMHYLASTKLPYDFYANPYESLFASYDAVKENLKASSVEDATNIALRVAMSVIEEWRHPGLRQDMDLAKVFDVTLPPVFVVALMESADLMGMFRVIFELRREAKNLRKAMRRLDDTNASWEEIVDTLEELKQRGRIMNKAAGLLDFVDIGVNFLVFSIGIPLSALLPRRKKTFLERLRASTHRQDQIAGKITEIFGNSGYHVDGKEVIQSMRQFLKP